mmetsp:Transcript_2940/g.13126  ORF Transcript_2940/g.13126 Transcript_2940/m.13126 type:complete len:237 (-) Transcript_2940:1606-2316(-)
MGGGAAGVAAMPPMRSPRGSAAGCGRVCGTSEGGPVPMRSPRGSAGAAPPAKGSAAAVVVGCVDVPPIDMTPMRSASGSTDAPVGVAAYPGVASYPAIRSPSRSAPPAVPPAAADGSESSSPVRSPSRSPTPPPPPPPPGADGTAVPSCFPRPATPCSASFDFITNGGSRSSSGTARAGPRSNIPQNSDARCCSSTLALVPTLPIAPRTALVCVLNLVPSFASAVIATCFTAGGAW